MAIVVVFENWKDRIHQVVEYAGEGGDLWVHSLVLVLGFG
jgi:hypothetical protein